ncbi:GntR family transcriptional regulator [Herbiconiux moechotypicola]|uniref:HTH gntR-type domain-containing protein n=1 Tax=Herbiconiux moechotypicola TaxID=637393 RepID=A0ABP5QFJ5_9MICO|nr:GntR family transcriptional regulator [Herbiconiux moechotypicola]MCS5729962.1 GntR family transcriptional regulator [Herbiconiux moechotypicola]
MDQPRRRTFTDDKILDLGQHRRQDEARRLRDLVSAFVLSVTAGGERLPSDEEIAREFSCTRNTARIAMQMLVQENTIGRTAGQGTYAHSRPTTWRTDRLLDKLRIDPPPTDHDYVLIGWRETTAVPRSMATVFAPSVARMAVFERVVLYRGRPGSLRTYYLPLRPDDVFTPADANDDVLEILEGRFGHRPLSSTRQISAISADLSAAELLAVEVGTPLLFIETTVRDAAGDVVMVYHGRQRSDQVRVELTPARDEL